MNENATNHTSNHHSNAPNERTQKVQVLIVDDHPIVREGLTQLINAESDLNVCGEAEEAQEAISRIKELNPQIAVVDVSLKGVSGIELIHNLKSLYPELPVLVLSMHDETMYAERALRAGARGYIMKQEATDLVMEAIRKVHRGEIYVSEMIKTRLIDGLVGGRPNTPQSPVELLSDRELEIFRKIGEGRSTRQIADALSLSPKTIESHRSNIKRKLKLKTATELQRYAFQWVAQEE